jgi:ParB-like chromosome segregation protein Spo0J
MAKTEYPYADPDDLFIIGLDTDDDEKHELFDERAHTPLDPNLVRNISVYGVLQPVIVREEAGKKYVVDGRQRVRAARRAKSKQAEAGEVEVRVPYLTSVVKGADRQRLAGVMVSTNEQRRADDILVKAAKASRMIALGSDMDEVAIAFGRSTTTIRQWLNLLESHPTLVQAVRHELIAVSAAHEVAKYPKEEQVGVLQALRQQSGGSRVTEALAKAYRQENGDSTASAAHTAAATSPAATPAAPAASAPSQPRGTKAKPLQSGVKRSWLRAALDTDAADNLADMQRGLLQWIATGLCDDGTWYDEFRKAAEAELADPDHKKKRRAKAKAAAAVAKAAK